MKIAFAAVEYDPEFRHPIAPFFYEVSVSVPITGRVFCDLDGRRTFKLRSKKIAEALAKAILDQEEHDLKDGGEESGEISIDPRSSWGDIEIDLGSGNSLFLAFPRDTRPSGRPSRSCPSPSSLGSGGSRTEIRRTNEPPDEVADVCREDPIRA